MDPRGRPYFAVSKLRYAWEDFPECAIYNSDGLPMPPFNVSLPTTPERTPVAGVGTDGATEAQRCSQQQETIAKLRLELAEARAEIAQLHSRSYLMH